MHYPCSPAAGLGGALFYGLLTGAAPAAPVPDWYIGISGMHFELEERTDGMRLNRERGYLPGIETAISIGGARWFMNGRFSYHNGAVDYEGLTSSGTLVNTRTDTAIFDGFIRTGRWLQVADDFSIAAYLGVGFRQWERNIRSTSAASGLDEQYRWPYASLGTLIPLSGRRDQGFTLDLRLLHPLDGSLDIDFHGLYDSTELDLNSSMGGRLSLNWTGTLRGGYRLRLESWYEHWKLDRSDPAPLRRSGAVVGTLYEPASDTQAIGLSLGLLFSI